MSTILVSFRCKPEGLKALDRVGKKLSLGRSAVLRKAAEDFIDKHLGTETEDDSRTPETTTASKTESPLQQGLKRKQYLMMRKNGMERLDAAIELDLDQQTEEAYNEYFENLQADNLRKKIPQLEKLIKGGDTFGEAILHLKELYEEIISRSVIRDWKKDAEIKKLREAKDRLELAELRRSYEPYKHPSKTQFMMPTTWRSLPKKEGCHVANNKPFLSNPRVGDVIKLGNTTIRITDKPEKGSWERLVPRKPFNLL